jgi:hypothetical protein
VHRVGCREGSTHLQLKEFPEDQTHKPLATGKELGNEHQHMQGTSKYRISLALQSNMRDVACHPVKNLLCTYNLRLRIPSNLKGPVLVNARHVTQFNPLTHMFDT